MLQHWKYSAVLAGMLWCWSQGGLAAGGETFNPELDPAVLEEDYAEVPVESIQQFVEIYGLVKDNYVAEKSDDELFQLAIKGLVGGLDRYSRYLSADEYRELVQYTEGDIASIDFNLNYDTRNHQWLIHELKPGSDSSKLGLRNGVSVLKIDNQELKNLNHSQVNNLLHGTVGSTVEIQLGANTSPINLVRNKKIEADIEPLLIHNQQVLVLKVHVFQQDTANQIKSLLEDYQSPRLKTILIDLRNNPGGLLSAAVEAADLFLNQGLIVTTKSRSEGSQQFQALPGNEFQNLKLGVLINNRSASAAEVFTGALKFHKRAWVIGEKSYGKGVVQKLFPLPNGAALQMTVSHYYTPDGSMIEGRGIQPNQVYPMNPTIRDDTYLDNVAEQLLKKYR